MKCVLCGEEEAIPGWDICSMCDYRIEQRRIEKQMEKEYYEQMEREFWNNMMIFDELQSFINPDENLIYE